MNLNLAIPKNIENVQPKISVIGVGGAGCNAINTMINSKVNNISFLVANTDGQALSRSMAKTQIQLGKELTNGLGAGSDYTVGEQAALESIDEIMMELEDVNMLFIATGMGGGTGTGAAPIIAQKAKEKGILTIAVVTKPFNFEGKKRMETALIGLEKLEKSVDTLIIIPNQNLFRIANDKTTFSEAFQLADDVLYQGIIGITDLITSPGMINLDFSDIKTVMKNKGQAMMGTGEHSGENRAKIAAEMALNNPLLDNSSIDGASSILLNIKGGLDLALFEVDEAASLIRSKVNENANIIFGSSIDESLDGIINISVVATGVNQSLKTLEEINTDKNQTELSQKEDHILKNEEQIDIESKLADLNKTSDTENIIKENKNDSLTFLETKEKELSNILHKQSENLTNETEENQFLKKISNLFSNNKHKNIVNKLEKDNEVYPLKDIVEKETSDENKPMINLNENPIKSDNNNEQISLLDIDENEKTENMDDVLEIPAFLRRQAN
jgi:cell division protein FtsZ